MASYSSESGIEIIRQLNSIKPPDIKLIEQKLRSCSQLFDKILPTLSYSTVQEPSNSFSEKYDINNSLADKPFNKNKDRKLFLKKEHWKLNSEISAKTFFENNYGPKLTNTKLHCFLKPIRINNTNLSAHQLSFVRGFKTIRSDPERRSSIFDKIKQDASGQFQDLKLGEKTK